MSFTRNMRLDIENKNVMERNGKLAFKQNHRSTCIEFMVVSNIRKNLIISMIRKLRKL